MKTKPHLFFIHGGMTFKNKKDYLSFLKHRSISLEKKNSWNGNYLDKKIGNIVDIIRPQMPLKENASYEEWKIHFERYIPYLQNNIIFIGYSLGGIFLAKYLSEHKFPKKILSTYLICPPFDNTIKGEDLVNGFTLKRDISLLNVNSKNLIFLFSKDDETVPASHAEKYKEKLPNANFIVYESKNGHFKVPEFPELIKMIKEDIKRIK